MNEHYDQNLIIVRLCHLKKESKNNEFGFNLRKKSKEDCHYIGRVDKNTPADLSGLKSGDKILEINRINIDNLNHDEILKLLKMGLNRRGKIYKNELLLMVIDKDVDEKFKISNQSIDSFDQKFEIEIKSSCLNFRNLEDGDGQNVSPQKL